MNNRQKIVELLQYFVLKGVVEVDNIHYGRLFYTINTIVLHPSIAHTQFSRKLPIFLELLQAG